jgi:hypothetical protein
MAKTKNEMTPEQRRAERERGRKWFTDLSLRRQDEIATALVLGEDVDWCWMGFDGKPSKAFLDGVDYAMNLLGV